jgi:hypothetical protein
MRSIPDPGFAEDDGSAPDELAEALAAYDADAGADGAYERTLAVLAGSRLLVPVLAVLGEVEVDADGLAHDKTSDMATVMMRGRDGRTALLAFTGEAAMHRWNRDARPVPVPTSRAAEAAVQDGAEAMLVDVAGPVPFVVETDDLRELAAGHALVRVGDGVSGPYAWVRPGR